MCRNTTTQTNYHYKKEECLEFNLKRVGDHCSNRSCPEPFTRALFKSGYGAFHYQHLNKCSACLKKQHFNSQKEHLSRTALWQLVATFERVKFWSIWHTSIQLMKPNFGPSTNVWLRFPSHFDIWSLAKDKIQNLVTLPSLSTLFYIIK